MEIKEILYSTLIGAIADTMSIYSEESWEPIILSQLNTNLKTETIGYVHNKEKGLFPLITLPEKNDDWWSKRETTNKAIYLSYVSLKQPEIPLERYLEVVVSKIYPFDYRMQTQFMANFLDSFGKSTFNKDYKISPYLCSTDVIMNDICTVLTHLSSSWYTYRPNVEEVVEKEIEGKDCTFTAFVVEAVKVALENLKEENWNF